MSSLEDHLQPGDAVLDVGANIGEYAQRYAKAVGPTGSVLAIEPDPETAAIARRHLAATPWATVMCVAVSDAMRVATLYRDRMRARNSLWLANVVEPDGGSCEVHTVSLAYLTGLVPNLRGIKIDAQGSEMAILRGGERALANPALTWEIELWPMGLAHAGSSVREVADVFEAHQWMPVGRSWASVREEATRHGQHSAFDIVLQHRERV